jgi:general secretion pathway protein H
LGYRRRQRRHQGRLAPTRGFTLIELMVVLAIVAIGVAVVALALRDPTLDRLERDATRLAALLEMARAEARASGLPVAWVPAAAAREGATGLAGQSAPFHFVGLSAKTSLPSQWLDPRVQAQVISGPTLRLGPEAILPPQRVLLSLDGQRIEVASDGLEAFGVVNAPAAP